MAGFSQATRDALLDLMFGSGHVSPFPSAYDVALSTTQPTDNGANVTEPSDTYVRVEVPNDDEHWIEAVAGRKTNTSLITFPLPMGDWGTIGYIAVYDHGTSTFRGWCALAVPVTIGAHSDYPQIPDGCLVFTA